MRYLFIILIPIFLFGCLTQSPQKKQWGNFKNGLKKTSTKNIDPKYCQLYKQSPNNVLSSSKTTVCYVMANGNIYDGEVSKQSFNGRGIIHYITGHSQDITSYFGDWENSLMQGKGVITYKNNNKYIGEMNVSQRHGIGILYDPNGNILKDGEWINNRFIKDIQEDKIRKKEQNKIKEQARIKKDEEKRIKFEEFKKERKKKRIEENIKKAEQKKMKSKEKEKQIFDNAKVECEAIGYKKGTDKFGECVLDLTE